ncbi:hypothetical protein F0562_033030 [Nyssa sinensis]|uniref:Uncharacterized protein n=1 Tax=Nyssa sinensis TaxID=561372 RepID=A0A5J5APC9_9ASTE|nr:hypothetical protein F0562_033030 [Nyssa sinensis]
MRNPVVWPTLAPPPAPLAELMSDDSVSQEAAKTSEVKCDSFVCFEAIWRTRLFCLLIKQIKNPCFDIQL